MAAAAVGFVQRYAYPLPYADEWSLLSAMTGQQPLTLEWLWSAHNEHRVFLPRLVILGLGWATGWDYGLMAQFNVAVLALLAAVLIATARAIRGRNTLGDAVFPLVLLSWSHHANLVWRFQIGFVLPMMLSTLALALVARWRRLTLAGALVITICLLGAGACGANGICFALPIAAWFVLTAIWEGKGDYPRSSERPTTNLRSVPGCAKKGTVPISDDRSPAGRLGLLVQAALLAGFAALYFWDFRLPPQHSRPPGVGACVRTTLEFVAGSLGPAAEVIWPLSALIVAGAVAVVAW
jgi:hypothetical protein